MSALPAARSIRRAGDWSGAWDVVTLTYDDRFLRRRVLTTVHDERFLVDLPHTESVDHGDAFALEDGRLVEAIAAEEELLAVTGDDLPRLAWHIGNRHTPCQIETGRLLIKRDHVIRDMLSRIGATVAEVLEPFTPEGGAYGHGRTHSHEHGASAHVHAASHSHGEATHAHVHSHAHDRTHTHTLSYSYRRTHDDDHEH